MPNEPSELGGSTVARRIMRGETHALVFDSTARFGGLRTASEAPHVPEVLIEAAHATAAAAPRGCGGPRRRRCGRAGRRAGGGCGAALPLIMTHGWPGWIVELLETVEPLTNPTAHGGCAADAFDLVLLSIPGYGFSDQPTEIGWDTGRGGARLGGADAPSRLHPLCRPRWRHRTVVTDAMGRQAPAGLLGIHMNLLVTALGGAPMPTNTDEERAAAAALAAFNKTGSGYLVEQSTRPQTIGYALLDSPVALAAWMLDHDTDSHYKIARAFLGGPPSGNLTRDHILDNVTLYWLTGTGVSAARSYWENQRARDAAGGQIPPPVTLPVAFSASPARSSRPRAAGSSSATRPSCTTTSPPGAGTSPPGRSPSCSRARSGPRSGPCANPR
jgi:hypothetical protein